MPGAYYYDEEHISEWLGMAKTHNGVQTYLQKYVFGVNSFEEYLELCGGIKQMNYLKRRESMREPMIATWKK
jgi:glutaconate CoA-transferase, subunit A